MIRWQKNHLKYQKYAVCSIQLVISVNAPESNDQE